MTLEELVVRVRVVTDGLDSGLDAALDGLKAFSREVQSISGDSAKAWRDLGDVAGTAFVKMAKTAQIATQDIHSESSAMLDNASATRDAADAWKNYVRVRENAAEGLVQARRTENDYQDITQSTSAQMAGLQTQFLKLENAQAKSAVQSERFFQTFKSATSPVESTGMEMLNAMPDTFAGIAKTAPAAAKGIDATASSAAGLADTSQGLQKVIGLLKNIGMTAGELAPLGWVSLGVEAVSGIYKLISYANESAAKEEAARAKANQDVLDNQKNRLEYLTELTTEYYKLSGLTDPSYSESRKLVEVMRELASVYGVVMEQSGDAALAQQNYNAALDQAYKKELEALSLYQSKVIPAATKDKERLREAFNLYRLNVEQQARANLNHDDLDEGFRAVSAKRIKEDAQKYVENAKQVLDSYKPLYIDQFYKELELGITEAELRGDKVNRAMLEQLRGMFDLDLSSFADQFQDDPEVVDKYISDMSDSIISACASPAATEAITTVQNLMRSIYAGVKPASEEVDALKGAWSTLFGENGVLAPFVKKLAETTGESAHQIAESIVYGLTGFKGLEHGTDVLTASADTVESTLRKLWEQAAATGEAFHDMSEGFDGAGASAENATKQTKTLLDRYNTLTQTLQRCERESKILEKGQAALNKAKKEGGKLSAQEERDLKAASKLVGYQGDRYDELGVHIKAYGKGLESTINASVSELGWLGGELENAAHSSNINGQVQVDCGAAASNIQGLISIANAALTVLQMLGIVKAGGGAASAAPKRGGGGGGGGGKRNDEEEEARRAAEEAERRRREAIEADYARIDHKRHLNQITLEEELAMLDQLRARHRLNAEEIMDWEERVYDLKQELRERDADSLDNLSDGVLTALEARYEAMLDAERQRLEQSRQAWEDWRDQSVKAIEDQIAALDELADTEDREKKDQEELRKIAKLRQQIAFEQDDYNRAKLEQQLAQALESREERLRKLALEDQKEALRAEIDQIEQKADDQIAALDREEQAIEEAYEQRLKDAALRAEAEKLILTQSQDELLSLLREYAPDYDATGQTLGEKLLDGFTQKVGGIAAWFEDFNSRMAQAQEHMAQLAQSAADSFYHERQQAQDAPQQHPGVTVNQSIAFNQPVDSPAQMARRMEQVNEELALLL